MTRSLSSRVRATAGAADVFAFRSTGFGARPTSPSRRLLKARKTSTPNPMPTPAEPKPYIQPNFSPSVPHTAEARNAPTLMPI